MNVSERDNGKDTSRAQRLGTNTALLEKIQKLSFVKCELELYLDTHPTCRAALDYYKKTVEMLDAAMLEYHNTVGPIVATGTMNGERWTWVDEPWPWFREGETLNAPRKDKAK
jgi:spore coat protein JB